MSQTSGQLHGIWRILPSAAITEIIAQSGFDFQILDCEHGSYDYITLQEDIRACDIYNCAAYIRVSGLNKVEVQRCLDLGAHGIVFPQLTGYDDFLAATRLLNYGPNGDRGFNPFVRASGYGIETKKREPALCITIVETLQAVNDLDEILNIKEINMIYIGSYDLSAQLGVIGQMNHPKLIEVVNTIIQKCKAANKTVGLMIANPEQYKASVNKGVNAFVHTVDSHQIKRMFTAAIEQLQ